jgi:hypothetical protein
LLKKKREGRRLLKKKREGSKGNRRFPLKYIPNLYNIMDLFSFTNLIIISFVIIGGYILLTSQIEGRARVVLILSVTIAFFVILFNLPMFKSFSEGVNYPKLTSETIKPIDNYTISPSYSLSMWIYISDWNDKLGKEIFSGKTIDITSSFVVPGKTALVLEIN